MRITPLWPGSPQQGFIVPRLMITETVSLGCPSTNTGEGDRIWASESVGYDWRGENLERRVPCPPWEDVYHFNSQIYADRVTDHCRSQQRSRLGWRKQKNYCRWRKPNHVSHVSGATVPALNSVDVPPEPGLPVRSCLTLGLPRESL